MIGSLDPVAAGYLRGVRDELASDLGADLAGFYLYGSSVSGQFVGGQSDLDVIAVVEDWLPAGRARTTLRRILAVPRPDAVKGLDLWIVPRHSASTPRADPPFECWLLTAIGSELTGGEHHPGDARLVLLYQMCRDHGFPMAGPPPRQMFGELERSWVIDAMRVDLGLRGQPPGTASSTPAARRTSSTRGRCAASWRARPVSGARCRPAAHRRRRGVAADGSRSHDAGEGRRRVRRCGAGAAGRRLTPRAVPLGLPSAERGPLVEVRSEPPLVTCVLAARASAELLALSGRRFIQQDWPDRELLVLRPPDAVNAAALPLDPRIRTVEMRPADRGRWRELALAHARGSVLAAWDPLTWYAFDRLTQQVRELGATSVARVVAPSILAFDPVTSTSRRVAEAAVVEQSTLCAHRHAWTAAGAPAHAGARPDLAVLLDPGIARARGEPADAADVARLLGDHISVYSIAVATYVAGRGPQPPVSCLMPTYNRRPFAARAIDAFLAQDYPERELVILDDGEDPIADLVPADDARPVPPAPGTSDDRTQAAAAVRSGRRRRARAVGRRRLVLVVTAAT